MEKETILKERLEALLKYAEVPFEKVNVYWEAYSAVFNNMTLRVTVTLKNNITYSIFAASTVLPKYGKQKTIEILERSIWIELWEGEIMSQPVYDLYGQPKINLTTLLAHPDWIYEPDRL